MSSTLVVYFYQIYIYKLLLDTQISHFNLLSVILKLNPFNWYLRRGKSLSIFKVVYFFFSSLIQSSSQMIFLFVFFKGNSYDCESFVYFTYIFLFQFQLISHARTLTEFFFYDFTFDSSLISLNGNILMFHHSEIEFIIFREIKNCNFENNKKYRGKSVALSIITSFKTLFLLPLAITFSFFIELKL